MIYPTRDELLSADGSYGPPAERLKASFHVDNNGCWRWERGLTTSGYGHLWVRGRYFQAHRLMYVLMAGPVPAGLELDHLCRNRACVNPDHLEPVTRPVNMQRSEATRLDARQVEEIRGARSHGAGIRELGRLYGVNHSTVSRIVRGQSWPRPTVLKDADYPDLVA